MEKPRPYVTAALLCERVIQEKDESLTLIRLIDKIQYSLEGIGIEFPREIKPVVPLQGLIGLKSGPVTGVHKLKVVSERPNGERKDVFEHSFELLGKDHGQNIIMRMNLGIDQDGLYWLDVLFDDEVLTRIPLIVSALPQQVSPEPRP